MLTLLVVPGVAMLFPQVDAVLAFPFIVRFTLIPVCVDHPGITDTRIVGCQFPYKLGAGV